MVDVLPVTVWSVVRSLPACRWRIELVDDFSSGHQIVAGCNQAGKHSTKQWCKHNSDLLIGYKIRPVHPFDNPIDVVDDALLRDYVLTLYSST